MKKPQTPFTLLYSFKLEQDQELGNQFLNSFPLFLPLLCLVFLR